MKLSTAAMGGLAAVAGIAAHDLTQRKHSLLRTFPVLGHGRYLVEEIGPELRQYIVASNDEERPFSRDQRRYIYASAKGQNTYFGFGSDNDFDTASNYPVIKHRTFADVAPPPTTATGTRSACRPPRSWARRADGPTPSGRGRWSTSPR
ncbi:hypothetical protein [Arsenicicoccus dermatophilus]|uniref:hypothetical protein n=1 Tax=Arsenicicoccus dermatophilus TaxID=1076331 RepID=UPI003916DDC8